MTRPTLKQIILILAAVLVIAAIIYGFLPEAETVETERIVSGILQVIVEEEGQTEVEEKFIISSPVAANIRRVDLEPGDWVEEGTELVRLAPPPSGMLDARSQAEATARVKAAEATLQERQLKADHARTVKERMERLGEKNSATPENVLQAQLEAASAIAARDAAGADLAAAQAALGAGGKTSFGATEQALRAPVSGTILAVHRKSEGTVNPGEPLLEIGDTGQLEVAVDVLSQDAVRIRPGMRVVLDQWGGSDPLEGAVKSVGQQGKLVISPLGVEEQRVTVTVNLVSPPAIWRGLGSGYRVLARFIIWEQEEVLQVPNSALFRTGEGWEVFVVEDDIAMRRRVTVGQQTGLHSQVLEGLSQGEIVIIHPAAEIEDGVRVEVR